MMAIKKMHVYLERITKICRKDKWHKHASKMDIYVNEFCKCTWKAHDLLQ